ncbi:hypothetical protein BC833DRAFT_623254 [Globomyces pollinis-pini]|nr:hypothetical protein BC833DRAFT_623254 [Globomyces pollinis-pini]
MKANAVEIHDDYPPMLVLLVSLIISTTIYILSEKFRQMYEQRLLHENLDGLASILYPNTVRVPLPNKRRYSLFGESEILGRVFTKPKVHPAAPGYFFKPSNVVAAVSKSPTSIQRRFFPPKDTTPVQINPLDKLNPIVALPFHVVDKVWDTSVDLTASTIKVVFFPITIAYRVFKR